MVVIKRETVSIVLLVLFIGVFVSPLPAAFAALSITITSINNTTPRWGVDTVTVSGNLTNFHSTDTVTVVWGDGNTSPNNPISGISGTWGPVSHIYPIGTVGSHTINAKLYSSSGALLATSSGVMVNVQKHITALSTPTLNSTSVKWGKAFMVNTDTLTDSDAAGVGISGKQITFSGNGTTGTPSGTTTGSGNLAAPVTVTAPGIFNVGRGNVFANFVGDANYLASSSSTTIQIIKHVTSLSAPTFTLSSVPWGQTFTVDSILTDSDLNAPISGVSINYNGNGTASAKADFSNSTGHIQTTLTAPGFGHEGQGKINATFAGDNNYLPIGPITSTITITRHSTTLSMPTFNSTTVQSGKKFTADSVLTDSNLNAPISGENVNYSGNGTSITTPGVSNSTGHSKTTLTAATVNKTKTGQVMATFAGDNNYLPTGSATSSITITPVTTPYVNAALIKHIVVIMQENRSFDSYFGTFPGANGIPPGECMPLNAKNPSLGCVMSYHTPNFTNIDLQHDFQSSITSEDGGKMDNFIVGEEGRNETMAYQDNTTIPNYWTFAKNYVLADNFFSSVHGWSMPNHWYSIAGQAPEISIPTFITPTTPQSNKTTYLQEANATGTVVDIINGTGTVSWKYYDLNFGNIIPGGYNAAKANGYAYDFWNPFASKASTYTARYSPHFVPHTQIFADLQNNQLPQISWVIPPDFYSEHDPASSHVGMIWTTDVVDAIMNSTAWNSTAIIITWDDYGGYYDHVPPLNLDYNGSGERVPAIIISPYAKAGHIDHTPYIFESTLKMMEWKFNMTSLTTRDANANNLLNAFDFAQNPRPPTPIHLSANDLAQLTPTYLIPSTGHVGDKITFIGNGFSPQERGTVTYSGAVVASGIANSTGTIATSFKAPNSPFGCQWVIDRDHTGTPIFGLGLISHCFTIQPNEILNPSTGPSGAQIMINGTGFSAGSTITIKYDGTTQSTTTSNSTGNFGRAFVIPQSNNGTHTISATDANGRTSSATFVVQNAIPSIAITSVNNTSPKWSVDTVSVSGTALNAAPHDNVTVSWGDSTNSSRIPISGNSWGPVVHTYSSSAIALNPNQVIAKLIGSGNSVKATSTSISVIVQRHPTTLSIPILSSTSVKWGKTFNVNATTLTDSATGQGISGETINFSGNATTGTPTGATTTGGGLTAAVTITASTNVGTGNIVAANFTGDANYMPSGSPFATIKINAHGTALTWSPLSNVPWGGSTSFQLILTDADNGGMPVQGETISFNGTGVIGVSNQTTNSIGKAVGSGTAPSTVSNGWKVQAHFGGDLLYLKKDSTIKTYSTLKHGTALVLSVIPSNLVHGTTYKVTGTLKDTVTGQFLSSKTIAFTADAPIVINNATTDGTGTYIVTGLIAPSTPGTYHITANFAGTSLYLSKNSITKTLTVT